jgi:hypothetical protein
MTQAHLDDFSPRTALSPGANFGRVLNLVAAVSAAGLALGAGVWAYQIAMRDISGVPVIRAIEAPMRMAPQDPGGQIASYRGLAVNEVIGGTPGQTAAQPTTRAPDPIDLRSEDAPGMGLVALVGAPLDEAVAPEPDATTDLAAPLGQDAPGGVAAVAMDSADPAGAWAGAVAQIPRPMPRPARLGSRSQQGSAGTDPVPRTAASAAAGNDPVAAALASAMAALAPLTSAQARELRTDDIAPGTRLVQLGTYDDVGLARAAWDGLAARAGALMAGKARVIEAAEISGQSFYRLRVQGFDSEDAARRFCAAVETSEMRCVPVTQR